MLSVQLMFLLLYCVVLQLAREQKLRELLHSPHSSPKHSAPGALLWHGSNTGQHSPASKLASTWSHSSPTKGQQQQQQQWRPGSPLSTMAAGEGGDGVEPYKALQQQLLSDVDAVRKRQKPGFIRYVWCVHGSIRSLAAMCQCQLAATLCLQTQY